MASATGGLASKSNLCHAKQHWTEELAMWQIKHLNDKEKILAFLQQDRTYAAYAIGDLEPSLFAQCQWFGAENDGQVKALALFFTGLQPPALFIMGDTDGLASILASALQPERAYFTCRAEHLPVVEASYVLDEIEEMFRMAIAPADFRPVSGPATKLDLSHLDALRQLYRLGGGDAFAPYQLRDGVYWGVATDGQLISAAGTHLVSPTFGVAAVGNIFTHPNHRRRGYATTCTSHVVEELLALRQDFGELSRAAQDRAQGLDIVLNVNRENTEAISIYEKLGFRRHCPYIEVIGNRK
jgi:ribosomal protein S18 acetylase RimI-like enzyme